MFSYFMWIGMALLFIGAFGIIVNDNKQSKEKPEPEIITKETPTQTEIDKDTITFDNEWRKEMDDSMKRLDHSFKEFGLKFGVDNNSTLMGSMFLLADEHLKLKARVDKLEGGK